MVTCFSGNLLIEISDHLTQFLILQGFVKERGLPETNLFRRNFSNFNEREIKKEILNMNWINICKIDENDPNISWNNFFNSLTYQLDEYAILKSISNENDPTEKTILWDAFKKLRNEITKDKRDSKKSYFHSYFEKNKLKSAEVWKGIRSLVNIKASKSFSIKLLNENNNLISDPKIISNVFNDYFSSIGLKIPIVPGSFKEYFEIKDVSGKSLINPSNASFFLSPIVPAEIEKLIDALDIKKSTGPNSIPVFILKILKPFFPSWLSKLVNLSFTVGIFPDILKIAKITPMHKKECKLSELQTNLLVICFK